MPKKHNKRDWLTDFEHLKPYSHRYRDDDGSDSEEDASKRYDRGGDTSNLRSNNHPQNYFTSYEDELEQQLHQYSDLVRNFGEFLEIFDELKTNIYIPISDNIAKIDRYLSYNLDELYEKEQLNDNTLLETQAFFKEIRIVRSSLDQFLAEVNKLKIKIVESVSIPYKLKEKEQQLSKINREEDSVNGYYEKSSFANGKSYGFRAGYSDSHHRDELGQYYCASDDEEDKTTYGRRVTSDDFEEKLAELDYQKKQIQGEINRFQHPSSVRELNRLLSQIQDENIKLIFPLESQLNKAFENLNIILPSHEKALEFASDESFFHGLFDEQPSQRTDWYSEDRIAQLLSRLLPDREHFYISPQTQLEHLDLTQANANNVIENIIGTGRVAVLPVHLNSNHWVGILVRQQENRDIQVIVINPTGQNILQEGGFRYLMNILETRINELNSNDAEHLDVNVIDLRLRQQYNGNDCGPFTVNNLYRLATAASNEFDFMDAGEIIEAAGLYWPGRTDASFIREEHLAILANNEVEAVVQSEVASYQVPEQEIIPQLNVNATGAAIPLVAIFPEFSNLHFNIDS